MTRVELSGHLVEDEEGKLYIADKSLADVLAAVVGARKEENGVRLLGYVNINVEVVAR